MGLKESAAKRLLDSKIESAKKGLNKIGVPLDVANIMINGIKNHKTDDEITKEIDDKYYTKEKKLTPAEAMIQNNDFDEFNNY